MLLFTSKHENSSQSREFNPNTDIGFQYGSKMTVKIPLSYIKGKHDIFIFFIHKKQRKKKESGEARGIREVGQER